MALFKLINIKDNYFVYESVKNNYVKIPKKLYEVLDKVQRNELSFNDLCNEITDRESIEFKVLQSLLTDGYFTQNSHGTPYYDISFLNNHEKVLEEVVIEITRKCNLRCKYCFFTETYDQVNVAFNNSKLTFSEMKKRLDYVLTNIKNGESCVTFYGGEPLLFFNLIKESVEYLESYHNPLLGYKITTNGLLLKNEILDFFVEKNFRITISLDGPEKIHDFNRVGIDGEGSFKVIHQNIESLRAKYPDFFNNNIRFHSVIPGWINLENTLSFLSQYGLKDGNITVSNLASGYSEKFMKTFNKEFPNSSHTHIEYMENLESYPNQEYDITKKIYDELFCKYFQLFSNKVCEKKYSLRGQCKYSLTRQFISIDGQIYTCEQLDYSDNSLVIGCVEKGVSYKRVIEVIEQHNNATRKCSKCWAMHFCTSCAAKYKEINNDECRLRKKTIVEDLTLVLDLLMKNSNAYRYYDEYMTRGN